MWVIDVWGKSVRWAGIDRCGGAVRWAVDRPVWCCHEVGGDRPVWCCHEVGGATVASHHLHWSSLYSRWFLHQIHTCTSLCSYESGYQSFDRSFAPAAAPPIAPPTGWYCLLPRTRPLLWYSCVAIVTAWSHHMAIHIVIADVSEMKENV